MKRKRICNRRSHRSLLDEKLELRRLPTGALVGDGILHFGPLQSQLGDCSFEVIASDRSLSDTKSVTLRVIDAPIKSTRISGRVLNIVGTPIVGIQVELGSIQGLTTSSGESVLDLGAGVPSTHSIRIRGELLNPIGTYPFIAETLPVLHERTVFWS